MPQMQNSKPNELREKAKAHYRKKENVEAKWLDQYGNLSLEDDYQKNRACLTETFNMLDVVMENAIDDFRHSHAIIEVRPLGRSAVYTFEGDDGKPVEFRTPSTFAARVRALRAIGYVISDDLFYGTRLLRNETAHGNQTIILQNIHLSYEDTIKAMLSMADTLITLGALDPSLRNPSFEKLRVREGDTLSNGAYEVGPLVGEGGMSRVYKARQTRVGREVAVKELKPGTYANDLIQHECEVLLRLHHDRIPQIHDVFYENSTFYIVMSYIDGVTLDRYEQGHHPLGDDTIRSICHVLLDILGYLHSPEAGIVFADLSPDNIMIDKNENPYLIDFGISSRMETRQNLPAATMGYSAPEVFSQKALDQRADIFSFGYLLRFLCTGLSPLEKTETPTAELISDLQLAEIINRCTAKNPEERYADITELKEALFPEIRQAPVKKSRRTAVIAACTVLAAAAGLGLYYQSRTGPDESASSSAVSGTAPGIQPELFFEESGLTDHAMDWQDDSLEKKMRSVTGIEGRDIMLSDVWGLQELYLTDSGITDISALKELDNISTLYLDGNSVEDLSPLSGMANLSFLNLNGNRVQDLAPLEQLQGLSHLELEDNLVEDISPVSNLPGLTYLDIRNNSVTDISPIAVLTELDFLDLEGNSINPESLAAVSGLARLTYLNLSFCDIQELPDLGALGSLDSLYLGHNSITSLDALPELPMLTSLELQNNPLGDTDGVLEPLAGMENLQWLDLEYTGVSDIQSLEGLTKLDHLDIKGNGIDNLSVLADKVELVYLDAAENHLSGGTADLSSLANLSYLDLHGNDIEDVTGLGELGKLEILYLQDNGISDISALQNLSSLRILNLAGNPVTDYSPVESLKIEELIR